MLLVFSGPVKDCKGESVKEIYVDNLGMDTIVEVQ